MYPNYEEKLKELVRNGEWELDENTKNNGDHDEDEQIMVKS